MTDVQDDTNVIEEVIDDANVMPQDTEPEETPEEQVEPDNQVEEETPAEPEPIETPEEKPSNRLLTRAQKLLEKYGPPEPRTLPQPSQLDYSQALDADPAVIQQLQVDRQMAQQLSYQEGLKKAEAIEFKTNIRLDLPLVTEKLSKLDPRDAEVLDREYLQTVGFDPQTGYVQNPNIGYAEFIEARIEMAERMGRSMTAQTTQNIAKQSAQTGLRPDGSQAKRLNLNQAPENMTLEELYAKIGQPMPKQPK